MLNCGPEVELKCACQVFDVGYACPCKGSAPHPDVTRPCLSTCDGEQQSGPQTTFTPPRCSLSPLSLSQLSPSLSTVGTRARSPWPPLSVARAPSRRVFCHPCGPSTLADHPSFLCCRAPLLLAWGSQPLPPSRPPWPLVLCSMAVVMAPLPLRILVPSSCHHHLRRAMPHTHHFFPGFLLPAECPAARAVPLGATGMCGQHATGHHGASRGHRWVHTNPVVLPRLLATDDEPPFALNRELLHAPSINPGQGLQAAIQEKTGAYLHSS
jgi:hypothetical protein